MGESVRRQLRTRSRTRGGPKAPRPPRWYQRAMPVTEGCRGGRPACSSCSRVRSSNSSVQSGAGKRHRRAGRRRLNLVGSCRCEPVAVTEAVQQRDGGKPRRRARAPARVPRRLGVGITLRAQRVRAAPPGHRARRPGKLKSATPRNCVRPGATGVAAEDGGGAEFRLAVSSQDGVSRIHIARDGSRPPARKSRDGVAAKSCGWGLDDSRNDRAIGARGSWARARPIMPRAGRRALSVVSTGRVGRHGPPTPKASGRRRPRVRAGGDDAIATIGHRGGPYECAFHACPASRDVRVSAGPSQRIVGAANACATCPTTASDPSTNSARQVGRACSVRNGHETRA